MTQPKLNSSTKAKYPTPVTKIKKQTKFEVMISIQELRIGNIIRYNGSIIPVSNIYIGQPTLEDAEPIPLSPEILEACGFEINQYGYRVKDGFKVYWDGMKSFQFNYDHNDEYNILELRHLHQLQNLYFAMTNTELEVKVSDTTKMPQG